MKTESYQLEFLTPCFCAGAEQAKAEVRAPSIRGKLRWWFRVLGATPAQEAAVFGSTAGNSGRAGILAVRAREDGNRRKWHPIEFSPMSNTGYLLYFAKASGEGVRWNEHGAIPSGSQIELQFIWRRRPAAELEERFNLARDAFLMLGSLGLRSSRGLGVFECAEQPFSLEAYEKLIGRIRMAAPQFLSEVGEFEGSDDRILEELGAQLRGLRRGFSAGPPGRSNPTPLGSSTHPRQASAVYLRPVRISPGQSRIVVFEAPAAKVLGRESSVRAPLLRNGLPSPLNASQFRVGR